jgi:hypothetical protein
MSLSQVLTPHHLIDSFRQFMAGQLTQSLEPGLAIFLQVSIPLQSVMD